MDVPNKIDVIALQETYVVDHIQEWELHFEKHDIFQSYRNKMQIEIV